jgi:hypothetical protein
LSSEPNSKKSENFSITSVNEDNVDITIPEIPITVEVQVNASPINGFFSKYLIVELLMKLDGEITSMGSVRIQAKDILN